MTPIQARETPARKFLAINWWKKFGMSIVNYKWIQVNYEWITSEFKWITSELQVSYKCLLAIIIITCSGEYIWGWHVLHGRGLFLHGENVFCMGEGVLHEEGSVLYEGCVYCIGEGVSYMGSVCHAWRECVMHEKGVSCMGRISFAWGVGDGVSCIRDGMSCILHS